jgi:hypothetical protein
MKLSRRKRDYEQALSSGRFIRNADDLMVNKKLKNAEVAAGRHFFTVWFIFLCEVVIFIVIYIKIKNFSTYAFILKPGILIGADKRFLLSAGGKIFFLVC